MDTVMQRNNIRIVGQEDGPALVLVQGFGCDQVIWDRMLPEFTDHYKVVLFDHAGTGGADPAAYDPVKYASLEGYRDDLIQIMDTLELHNAVVVGHSIAGAVALAASVESPRVGHLVLLCTSPRYLNDDGYSGGFLPQDLDSILTAVEENYPLWAASVAPHVTGSPTESVLSAELAERICRLHPEYVRDFLRMAFTADIRPLLPQVRVPSLILQTAQDPLTPEAASTYLHQHLPGSTFTMLDFPGTMPHLQAPVSTAAAIRDYLGAAARG